MAEQRGGGEGLRWERSAFRERAFVTCSTCGRWAIVTPSESGYVVDECPAGHVVDGLLKGWVRELSIARAGPAYDPLGPDGPGNTRGT